jgi:hypothetical protein
MFLYELTVSIEYLTVLAEVVLENIREDFSVHKKIKSIKLSVGTK